MPSLSRCLVTLLIAAFAGPAVAETWTRTSDVGRDPVTRTTRESYDFSATGRIDVRNIGGAVEIKAGAGDKVEYAYERRAKTQKDFDCETLKVDHGKDELRLEVVHKKEKDGRVVYADDTLTVTVPRGASVTVRDVGDKVTVSGVAGLVRLSDVGDDVVISDAQQVEVKDIGDGVKLDVTTLGPAGIRISDIGDTVELTLPEKVGARVRIGSVGDEIRGPGLRIDADENDKGYETTLGEGGPVIQIRDIGDSVVIRGPRLGRNESL
jgi:hypothetical protein